MSGGGAADDAIDFQREQVQKTYEYDAMMWHYNNSGSTLTVDEGGYIGSLGKDKGAYANFGMPPGTVGTQWRAYHQARAKQQYAQLNAAESKAWQEKERRRSWEYSEDRRRYDLGVQQSVFNKQQGTKDQQRILNQRALDLGRARENEVLNEALIQTAFENKEVMQDFDFDTFSLGFKKEEILNQLGLSNSRSDTESKQAAADLATQQKLNAAAQGRSTIELGIREKELNTAAALSHHDTNTAVAKALNESSTIQQQASLTEDKLLTEAQKAQTVLGQKTGDADFQVAEAELRLQSKIGDVAATKQGLTEDYLVKDAANRFNRAALGIDTAQIKQNKNFQNDLIGRDIQNQTAKAKFSAQRAHLESLKQTGQAAVLQAGRSQGKNIVSYLSLIGQQQAELVDSIVRAETVGQRKQRQNRVQALNDIQRSAIKSQQIDLSALESLNKLSLGISEADRSLDLATTQTGLELGKIGKSVKDATELTDITVKDLQREISARKGLTATSLKDIQEGITSKRTEEQLKQQGYIDQKSGAQALSSNRITSLLNEIAGRETQESILQDSLDERVRLQTAGADIATRSTQSDLSRLAAKKGLNLDIIQASETSARKAKEMNIADMTQAKTQADLMADARVIPPPTMAPGMQSPQPLQTVHWEPIPEPTPTPAPLLGAKMSYSQLGATDYLAGAGMGALAGLGTYTALSQGGALAGLGLAPTPIGIAVGLGTALAQFF